MNTKCRIGIGLFVALFGIGTLCASAAAQPRGRDYRDDRREEREHRPPPPPPGAAVAPPAAAPVAVAPPADPKVVAHLQQLEQQREKDRRARIRDEKRWEEGRSERAAAHRRELSTTWGDLVNRQDARAELNTHAERMARLNRILDIATEKGDTALATRCRNVIQREIARDARVLHGIRTAAGAR